jgi:hypothetical protein
MPLQDSSPDTVGAVSQGLASLGEADSATELLVAMRDMLLNPILWMDVASVMLRVLIIIVFTFAVIRLIDRTTETFTRRVKDLPHIHPKKQRALTISNLISSTARYFSGLSRQSCRSAPSQSTSGRSSRQPVSPASPSVSARRHS